MYKYKLIISGLFIYICHYKPNVLKYMYNFIFKNQMLTDSILSYVKFKCIMWGVAYSLFIHSFF